MDRILWLIFGVLLLIAFKLESIDSFIRRDDVDIDENTSEARKKGTNWWLEILFAILFMVILKKYF